MVKNLSAMQETWVRSLGREDPQEQGMATHSSILAWRIPRTGAWRATVHGVAESDTSDIPPPQPQVAWEGYQGPTVLWVGQPQGL